MIFLNFKAYEQGSGGDAVSLVKLLESVSTESGVKIIPVVQALDLREVVVNTKLEVWVQGVSKYEAGAHTTAVIAEEARDAGAVGTFLNHSEAKFETFDDLREAQARVDEVGLRSLIFAANIDELRKVVTLGAEYVSYEPPELIGSVTTSVAQAEPEIISAAVEIARGAGLPLIVGAGIKSGEDVRKSLELGATGVAVASDVVKAENPRAEIEDLVEGFK